MDMEQIDLGRVFQQLADGFQHKDDIVDLFDRLVSLCISVTSADEGGIVLADANGDLHVIASTTERAADVENAQLGTNEGPCHECYRTGQAVEVPDLTSRRQQWPAFAAIAQARGIAAIHATPLRVRDETIGTLCLFASRTGALPDRDAALVQTFADAATVAILQQHVIARHETLNTQLESALQSRVIIEQAKGALAVRLGVSVEEAFALLRKRSRSTGVRIHDVAAQVLAQSQ